MAAYVMNDLASKAGLSEQFEIASAATSAWEIGNPTHKTYFIFLSFSDLFRIIYCSLEPDYPFE